MLLTSEAGSSSVATVLDCCFVMLLTKAGSCGPDQLTFLQELLNGEEAGVRVNPTSKARSP